MTVNSLAPGFVKLFIQDALFIHDHTIGVNLVAGGAGDASTVTLKNLSTTLWTTAVDAYVALVRPLQSATATIQYAELWSKADADADPVFESLHLIGLACTGAAGGLGYNQGTWSYRTQGGGNGKVVLFNSIIPLNSVARPPTYGGAAALALASYIISATSMIYGRDNTYPVAVPKVLGKTNDALRKRGLVDI
jgi:hypothetical protein